MFHSLRGVVSVVAPRRIILSTSYGIEWSLACSGEAISHWREKSGEQVVYTHLIPREDVLNLYGYYSQAERVLFLRLIKVNGIGAAVALNILSTMSVSVVWQIIEQGDHVALTKVPKVGSKSAQRIVLHLRGSVELGASASVSDTAGMSRGVGAAVIDSLVTMGYDRSQVATVVSELHAASATDDTATEDGAHNAGDDDASRRYEEYLFKEALKRLT